MAAKPPPPARPLQWQPHGDAGATGEPAAADHPALLEELQQALEAAGPVLDGWRAV